MGTVNECWNCGYFRAFYLKGLCQFDKQNIGYCHKYEKIVDNKHFTCECWKNCHIMQNMRKSIATKKLDETLDCLLQIKQILAEELEEIECPPDGMVMVRLRKPKDIK